MTRRQLAALCVPPEASLIDAMRVMERGGIEVVFVVDADGRVVGTLTDGDVRRAILRGTALDDAAGAGGARNSRFTFVREDVPRVDVLDLMKVRDIRQIPVLDADARLVGLHLLSDLIGPRARPNWAIVMAGGQGMRLRPLTEHVPKPMLPVAGRPILERLVVHLVGLGIREIYLSVNYLGHVIEGHFGDGATYGCRIHYLRETRALGTGGALSLLPSRPDHPILVLNGDLVTQADFGRVLDFHETSRCAATMCLRPHLVEVPFGVAEVDGERLVAIREKPVEQFLVNAGVYVLSPEALDRVPNDREFPITELFEILVSSGGDSSVAAHVLEGDWMDVGRHDELRKARGQS